MQVKHCRWCGNTRPLTEFYRHPAMADGRLNKCKACCLEYARKRRLEDVDGARERARIASKTPGRRAYGTAAAKAHRAANPEKYRAWTAVGNALRDGRLRRMPCESCGDERSEAHHDDYAKPLEVRWLCRRHHHEHHS